MQILTLLTLRNLNAAFKHGFEHPISRLVPSYKVTRASRLPQDVAQSNPLCSVSVSKNDRL